MDIVEAVGLVIALFIVQNTSACSRICLRIPTQRYIIVTCESRRLPSIPSYTQCPSQLGDLRLQKNRIQEIHSGSLPFESLLNLDLSFNRISIIENGSFSGLHSLQSLALSGNDLRGTESGIFDGMHHLGNLYLDQNPNLRIANGTFLGLNHLESLHLASCRLGRIDQWTFKGLLRLKMLDLGGNAIVSIEGFPFTETPELNVLNLSLNKLTTIPRAISYMYNLSEVDISYNSITYIPFGSFQALESLQFLDVSHNAICDIDAAFLETLPLLSEVSLVDNNLTVLSENLKLFVDNTSLTFNASQNPLICDCQLRWLVSVMDAENGKIDGTCNNPPYVKGRSLFSLGRHEFACLPEIMNTSSSAIPIDLSTPKVTLKCPVQMDPFITFHWTIPKNVIGQIDYSNDTAGDSLILYPRGEYSGVFTCTASNLAGNASFSIFLEIGDLSTPSKIDDLIPEGDTSYQGHTTSRPKYVNNEGKEFKPKLYLILSATALFCLFILAVVAHGFRRCNKSPQKDFRPQQPGSPLEETIL